LKKVCANNINMKRQVKRQAKCQAKCHSKQRGAGSTDYAQSFYAYGVDPAQLSRFTLGNIDKAPMFNPLQVNTIIPTGTSGVIPTGAYYNSMASSHLNNPIGPPTPGSIQMGGAGKVYYVTRDGKQIKNRWIAHVYQFAEQNGVKYSDALKNPIVKQTYKKQ
jgi:hypothetical protein